MRETENGSHDLELIAGPCSITPENVHQLYDIAEIQVQNLNGTRQRAVSAVRCVGVKSRTERDTQQFSGMDAKVLEQIILQPRTDVVPPSVFLAEAFVRSTGLGYCGRDDGSAYSVTFLRA